MHELKDLLYERLLTTPNEQKEKIEYLKELILRDKINSEMVKKLSDELAQNTNEKEKEVTFLLANTRLFKSQVIKSIRLIKIQTRNDQIRKLDNDIKNVERFNKELIKRTEVEAEQQESSEVKASDGRK